MAGMPNPWSDVATAAEAAQGAGLPDFTVPEAGTELDLARIDEWSFRCMEGIAEADAPVGPAELTVRKGAAVEGGDISGDYNAYQLTWTQDVNGVEVTCSGNVEGRTAMAIWAADVYCYSITVQGSGDEQETSQFGLDAADIATIVSGTK